MRDLYVYVYLDPRKPGKWSTHLATFLYEPIYVGEGQGGRWHDHLYDKSNSPKANKIRKILSTGVSKREMRKYIIKVADNLVGNESVRLEGKLIKELGTRSAILGIPNGPLTNLKISLNQKTLVSEYTRKLLRAHAAKMIPEIKKSWKNNYIQRCASISEAYNRTPEASANRSRAQQNKPKPSKITRQKISNKLSGVPKSEEHRLEISHALTGKPKSISHCVNVSNAKCARWVITQDEVLIIVDNLGKWCKENKVNYSGLKSAMRRNKSFHGYNLAKST